MIAFVSGGWREDPDKEAERNRKMAERSFIVNVDATLTQRGTTHGDFGDNATFALQYRDLLRSMKQHWSNCTAEQRLALDEIGLKIARILSGGNKVKEHWDDIAGYATLGGKACTKVS